MRSWSGLQGFLTCFYRYMQVKRTLLFWALGDKSRIKALSLLLVLKSKLGKTQAIPKASQNKIAEIAGVSPSTIKRYIVIWERLGLIEWRGKKKDVLVVGRMAFRTKHRNISLDRLSFKDFKTVYEQFRSLLFLVILSCKSFVKRMIQTVNTSKDSEEVKAALKSCNRYVKRNKNKEFEYQELGISYSKIGQKIGFCKRTAEKIVKIAVKKRWCRKFTHFEWTHLPGVNGMYVEGFTFTTLDYGFVVKANTYKLSRFWEVALIGGKK